MDGWEGICSLKAEDGDGGMGGGEIIRPTEMRDSSVTFTLAGPKIGGDQTSKVRKNKHAVARQRCQSKEGRPSR